MSSPIIPYAGGVRAAKSLLLHPFCMGYDLGRPLLASMQGALSDAPDYNPGTQILAQQTHAL